MFLKYYISFEIQLFMSSTSKFKATPTFTFKGRTQSITKSNSHSQLPSPNQYNPEKRSLNKSPQIRFAKSKRLQWSQLKSKELSPGPGSHQLPSYITSGPKKTINKTKYHTIKAETPSPGQYNNDSLILKHKGASYSMPKKTMSLRDLVVSQNSYKPSPGSYQQNLNKSHSTSIKIGKSLRPLNVSSAKTPGPGAYQSAEAFNKSILSSSKCKLAKQIRKINFSLGQRSPGPCNYEKKNFLQQIDKKSFSMREKKSIKNELQKFPGPGRYQTPIYNKHKSAPHFMIPLSARPSFTDKSAEISTKYPGPGSHQLQYKDKKKFRSMSVHKFSRASTVHYSTNKLNGSNIGPGQYNPQRSFEFKGKNQPKFSIDSKTKRGLFISKQQTKPGPTKYNPDDHLAYRSSSQHRMGNSVRPNMIKHIMNNPGPGQYKFEISQRLGWKFKFPKQVRKNYIEQKIKKQRSTVHDSYQNREQFPNPPKYMGVSAKIKFNQDKISKFV